MERKQREAKRGRDDAERSAKMVCTEKARESSCKSKTVWQRQPNTMPARDRECNQSQMALLILHRCTTQTLT